jgi:hypothetical protein
LRAQTNTFPSSGYVGIGTTSPLIDLHLYSTAGWRPEVILESVGNTGAAYLMFYKARAGTTAIQNGDALGTLLFEGYSNGAYQQSSFVTGIADASPSGSNVYSAITFSSNHPSGSTYENMRITSQGNVGIGTSNPTQKLSVNGTIRAKELIVDTGWSDYVFGKGYRLAPLAEVEQHIKTEGHLPGIPSAADVAERGVSVGEMQSKLLAKIEELTLHQIAQAKELSAVVSQNARLQARVEELEGHSR